MPLLSKNFIARQCSIDVCALHCSHTSQCARPGAPDLLAISVTAGPCCILLLFVHSAFLHPLSLAQNPLAGCFVAVC